MSKGKFALGALIGAVAGVVAGILTAPKSGKETRADIKAKANEIKHEAGKKAEEVKHKGEEAVEAGRQTVDDYRDRVTRAAKSAKEEMSTSRDNKK